jgi:hypothetical protein
MCHECDDEYPDDNDVRFNADWVQEFKQMPPDVQEETLTDMQECMVYVMNKAEQQGFLFEMITNWPRVKVAMYEAACIMEKNILSDGHNH